MSKRIKDEGGKLDYSGYEVYDNVEVQANVYEQGNEGYYVDVDNRYSLNFNNKLELDRYLESEGFEYQGYEKGYEKVEIFPLDKNGDNIKIF